MTYLLNVLRRKEKELSNLLALMPESPEFVPEGSIRISRGRKTAYYWRKNGASDSGQYLKRSQMDIARRIEQNHYDRKVRQEVSLQLKYIRKLISVYDPSFVNDLYEKMIPERQCLVTPVIEPTDRFVENWLRSHPDQQNPYPIKSDTYTEKNERVRSKSEKIIADKLASLGIPYRYEARLELPGIGVIYPDFTILNVRTRKEWIWEHEGRMDDPDYSSKASLRVEDYERSGYWPGQQLIFTCETKDHPMNIRIMNELIERYLL